MVSRSTTLVRFRGFGALVAVAASQIVERQPQMPLLFSIFGADSG